MRHIAAHAPNELPSTSICRQIFFSSGVDLPDDYPQRMDGIMLDAVELPAGEKAQVSLQLPAGSIILFDPVTHAAHFFEVKGEPTSERRTLSVAYGNVKAPTETTELPPGPVRITLDNRSPDRVLPGLWMSGAEMHDMIGRRRPFLTAKHLLTNQTFRDLYRTDTLDIDQRLKITSLTFLFTDLKGSTDLYERVGDLVAFDLVQTHFKVLHEIVAAGSRRRGQDDRRCGHGDVPNSRSRAVRRRCACARRWTSSTARETPRTCCSRSASMKVPALP